MARTARKLSGLNIYHVMLRGINRQTIFENDGDCHYFMTVLKTCKEISGFRLHAFCLMTNHVHLLIEPAGEPLDVVFRRIDTRYAVWYNRKYQRAGHLFQDRFRSENVETDQYFMTVLRYILRNPIKAGEEKRPGTYRWSSYLAYEKGAGSVTDTEFAISLFGGRDTLIEYVQQENDESVMDDDDFDWRIRDDQAKVIMNRIAQCDSISAFQQLDRQKRQDSIRRMYQEGLSMGQISRLTGTPKTTVSKTIHARKDQAQEGNESLSFHESDALAFEFDTGEVW